MTFRRWRERARARRALRAMERQRAFLDGLIVLRPDSAPGEKAVAGPISLHIRATLEAIKPIPDTARVLEVGSGVTGLLYAFGGNIVGVDPLAEDYRARWPNRTRDVELIKAFGEDLPFPDAAFDVILCYNVVDHTEQPAQILAEIARVLKPGGLFFFSVNVHHPIYRAAAAIHAAWRAAGVPFEITPFADHTDHFTPESARRLFKGLPFRIASTELDVEAAKAKTRDAVPRHFGDRLKRLFWKNAVFAAYAVREDKGWSGRKSSFQ